jgi:hypothetical protein
MSERCDVCGFEWEAVGATAVPERVVAAVDLIASVLRDADDDRARDRPAPDVWSAVEYGCHVRDALYNLRDRIMVGVVEDGARPKPMFAAARIDLGLYATDDPATLATELELAARLFARTIRALTADLLAHTIVYPWPREAERSLAWVAAQTVHEAEHHAADIARLVAS